MCTWTLLSLNLFPVIHSYFFFYLLRQSYSMSHKFINCRSPGLSSVLLQCYMCNTYIIILIKCTENIYINVKNRYSLSVKITRVIKIGWTNRNQGHLKKDLQPLFDYIFNYFYVLPLFCIFICIYADGNDSKKYTEIYI